MARKEHLSPELIDVMETGIACLGYSTIEPFAIFSIPLLVLLIANRRIKSISKYSMLLYDNGYGISNHCGPYAVTAVLCLSALEFFLRLFVDCEN